MVTSSSPVYDILPRIIKYSTVYLIALLDVPRNTTTKTRGHCSATKSRVSVNSRFPSINTTSAVIRSRRSVSHDRRQKLPWITSCLQPAIAAERDLSNRANMRAPSRTDAPADAAVDIAAAPGYRPAQERTASRGIDTESLPRSSVWKSNELREDYAYLCLLPLSGACRLKFSCAAELGGARGARGCINATECGRTSRKRVISCSISVQCVTRDISHYSSLAFYDCFIHFSNIFQPPILPERCSTQSGAGFS